MTHQKHFLTTVGEQYKSFTLKKIKEISELCCVLREIVHEPSGATIMHIENDDPENLFCLSFKTLPSSSNGVAHILEHTVLCGSEKFPVKDPFFSMTRRSLNTYMNALTGSDFTCYPAATQVRKDFYNLLDVYIDAVFHPKLDRLSFLQEGHRLEFVDPENPKSSLEYKGIVFNEMKGSMSSPDSRIWHKLMEFLLPDLCYRYNSGGDPKIIPALTYEQLLAFHKTYYHPSRCLFFFYGNLPLKDHLDFILDKALKDAPKLPPLDAAGFQKRFSSPVYQSCAYPVQESEDLSEKTIVAFGWLTTHINNQEEALALTLLDSILMDTDASLLKKKLLASELCVDVEGFIDIEMSEIPYEIVFKGCSEDDVEAIQKCLFTSLEEIVQEGIPSENIESSLHQIELARTEISGDHSPFGLVLFMRSALAKQHGCPPENALMIHHLFHALLEKTKDPSYLTGLIRKYYLDNPHFVRLAFRPDPELSQKEEREEKKQLEKIQAKLTPTQIKEIVKDAKDLEIYQQESLRQNMESLPKVTLEDVPKFGRQFPLQEKKEANLEIFHHDCFTNQMVYAELIFDLPEISLEDLPYVQTFLAVLPELGVGKRDYEQNLNYIQAHTGGISAYTNLHPQASDYSIIKPALHIRGKALYRKADKLFSLLKETAESPRLDETKRIEELILQFSSILENKLNRNALKYAVQLAFSGLSSSGKILNSWYGLDYYKKITGIAANPEKMIPKLIDKLLALREKILCNTTPHLVISCDESFYHTLEKEQFYGLKNLPKRPHTPWKGNYKVDAIESQFRPIASPVAFTVKGQKTIGYLNPESPALNIAAILLDNKILHHEIREKGGAYGCGAAYSSTGGSFYLFSYRDPQIARTLGVFDQALEAIAKQKFSSQDLEEAKLGVIQTLDTPTSPGNRALAAYTWQREGKTKEIRQQYREKLLAVTPKEIGAVVEKELLSKKNISIIVSFAGKELIAQENGILAKSGHEFPVIPI